jgi:hypothetical protein
MSDYDAYYPMKPEQRTKDEQKDSAKIASSVGAVQDIIDWLNQNIEAHRGIDQIDGLNPATNPEAFMRAALLNQSLHTAFTQKLADFRISFDEIIREEVRE